MSIAEERLLKTKNNFHANIDKVDSIMMMGSAISEFTIDRLKKLQEEHEKFDGFSLYKTKLSRTISTIQSLRGSVAFREKYDILYNQGVVLIVAYFESFMNDIFRWVVDEFPEKIEWPEKQQRVSFDINMLSFGTPSIGELVATSMKGQINFQDLQSTIRFLNENLKLNIILSEDMLNGLIKYQALRNIFVHNVAKVDGSFLKQIRNTNIANDYEINTSITLDEVQYEDAKSKFARFVGLVYEKLKRRFIDGR